MRSDLLKQLTGMGPFFALGAHRANCVPPWEPLQTLLDADTIGSRSAQLAQSLTRGSRVDVAQVDARVADSVLQLGLVARLVSPWLGLAALGVRVPVEVADLRWIPSAGSSFELAVDSAILESDPMPAPAEWAAVLTQGLLTPVVEAVTGSPLVLWGNVTSAINGAVSASGATRPDLIADIREAALQLMGSLPVAAYTGQVGQRTFRRSSCCLLYRVGTGPAEAMCGDCVLGRRPARPRQE